MTWKTREGIAAGAYRQRANTVASSFTGLNVSSQSTLRDEIVTQTASLARTAVASDFVGNSTIRGFATLAANLSAGSVSATGVRSGDVILTGVYMSGLNASSTYFTRVDSVQNDGFFFRINGTSGLDMTIAWWRIA